MRGETAVRRRMALISMWARYIVPLRMHYAGGTTPIVSRMFAKMRRSPVAITSAKVGAARSIVELEAPQNIQLQPGQQRPKLAKDRRLLASIGHHDVRRLDRDRIYQH